MTTPLRQITPRKATDRHLWLRRLPLASFATVVLLAAMLLSARAEETQILIMDQNTYHVPIGYLVGARERSRQTDAFLLHALWPGLQPFFDVNHRKVLNGREEVDHTVRILIKPPNRINDINRQFEIDARNYHLSPEEAPSYMDALVYDRTYHGVTFIGTVAYPRDAAVFLKNGAIDGYVICSGVDTPDLHPGCGYAFVEGANEFRVSFGREYLADLMDIRRLTLELRDRMLQPGP